MSRCKRWFNRTHTGPKPLGLDDLGYIAAEGQETIPNAVHESNWDLLKRDSQFNARTECKMDKHILLFIMGSSGVGKKTLLKSVCVHVFYNQSRPKILILAWCRYFMAIWLVERTGNLNMMEDEVLRYCCDGYIYSLKIIFVTDPEASIPGSLSRYDRFGLYLLTMSALMHRWTSSL